jgi:glucokinase
MNLTAGVDIGGSSVTAVARTEDGEIVGRYDALTASKGGHQVVTSVVSAVKALEMDHCRAVGIGVPGQVDPEAGHVAMAVNLGIGPEPYGLAQEVVASLGCPVTIENDVRAAAVGAYESYLRNGHAPHSLALLNIGTGISAGVVVEGSLLRGAHGMAGEIGHLIVEDSGPLCMCGQRGCLEAVLAGPAISRAWSVGEDVTVASELFTAVAADDPAAHEVAARIIDRLTIVLTWLAAAYDPELIVLAGGVAGAGDALLGPVRDEIARRGSGSELVTRRLRPDQVTLMAPDDVPGARGAAVLAATQGLPVRGAHASEARNDP